MIYVNYLGQPLNIRPPQFTEDRPPSMPERATPAEALLAVLRAGYPVEVVGDVDNPDTDSLGGGLATLRALGWPLQVIPTRNHVGQIVAYTYALTKEFEPECMDGYPAIKMSHG